MSKECPDTEFHPRCTKQKKHSRKNEKSRLFTNRKNLDDLNIYTNMEIVGRSMRQMPGFGSRKNDSFVLNDTTFLTFMNYDKRFKFASMAKAETYKTKMNNGNSKNSNWCPNKELSGMYDCSSDDCHNCCICYMKQPLDYFENKNKNSWALDIQNQGGWKQRFMAKLNNYQEGGPVFLLIGGQGIAGFKDSFEELATRHGAAMISIEHRYFGWNDTFSGQNVTNLEWLTISQTLRDVLSLIMKLKRSWNLNGPWIAFGCSYAGTLTAWLKKSYPNSVAGAVSSSAPIHAKPDFYEYNDFVLKSLSNCTQDCSPALEKNLNALVSMAENQTEWGKITTIFDLSEPFDGSEEMNITYMLFDIMYKFGMYFQSLQHTADTFSPDLKVACAELIRLGEQALGLTFKPVTYHFSYKTFITEISSRSCEKTPSVCWLYLACNELGWFQTFNTNSTLRRYLGVDHFSKLCIDLFGQKYTPTYLEEAAKETNKKYGGLGIFLTHEVDDLLMFQGSTDPWKQLGHCPGNAPNANFASIVIEGGSHCSDTIKWRDGMPSDICKARNVQIEKWILRWIKPKNRYPFTSSHPASTKAKTKSTAKRTKSQPTLPHTTVEGSTSLAGYSRSELDILGIMIFTTILN